MAPDSHDRWLFLLTLAATPLACTEEVPGETTSGETTGTGTTTTTMPPDTTTEGSTSIVTTTGVDGTSSTGETTVADDSTSGTSSTSSSSSSEGTTMSIDPSTSSGESSTTGEPQGLCELWGENRSNCYGGYYNPVYYTNICYEYLMSIDVMCAPAAAMLYQCQAGACFVDCGVEYDALDECNNLVLAMQLGCDMIAEVPAVGTIDMQCTGFIDQVEVCSAGGYYIPFFSWYVDYNPVYAEYACVNAWIFTNSPPPLGMGDPCGGAYEELLTCLSGLACNELEDAIFDDTYCAAERDAVTCRCDLGA